jgi:hypothetical protein
VALPRLDKRADVQVESMRPAGHPNLAAARLVRAQISIYVLFRTGDRFSIFASGLWLTDDMDLQFRGQ